MRIITKPTAWLETKNPFVDDLGCPMCGGNVALDAKVALIEGPQVHVNLQKISGHCIVIPGVCLECGSKILLRMSLAAGGAKCWTDVIVDAKTYNDLMEHDSVDQLPCMCPNCKVGMTKDCDASVQPPQKAQKTKKSQPIPPGSTIVPLENTGRKLTNEQIEAIVEEMKVDFNELARRSKVTVSQAVAGFIDLVENYLNIKFQSFAPKASDDPELPPAFPVVVPMIIHHSFKNQDDDEFMCQHLINSFLPVDYTLKRQDLPASVIYNTMCRMCKLSDCEWHPTHRPKAGEEE